MDTTGNKWTDQQISELISMTARGFSRQAIADHLGKPWRGVKDKAERLGIRPASMPTAKKPDPQVKERKCLKCGDGFESQWVGHRICPKCAPAVDKMRGSMA